MPESWGRWAGPEGIFCNQSALGDDIGSERFIFRRIDDVKTAPEYRDGPPLTGKRSSVGRRIDAAGKAADDGDSFESQFAAELLGDIFSVGGGEARSDDRDTDLFGTEGSLHIEKRRIIVNVQEVPGIEGILTRHDGDAKPLGLPDLLFGLPPVCK